MKQIDMQAFAEDVAAGQSVNQLAKKYKIAWSRANKLSGKCGGDVETMVAEETDEDSGSYTITIDIPAERIDDLLRGIPADELLGGVLMLSAQDKAAVFQNIMQRRLNEVLEPKEVQLPLMMPTSA